MSKIPAYSLGRISLELEQFRDDVTNKWNLGKYAFPSITTPPTWNAQTGESVLLQPTSGGTTLYIYYGSAWVSQLSAGINANLTGPITSIGNATSIASQTGTGTKFVVDTSPTIITPAITIITRYNNIPTVSGGVPAEYATVDLINQSAAIGDTAFYAVPASGAGMYRISWVATVTTAATTSSVLGGTTGFQIGYTDNDDSVVKTMPGTVVAGLETNSNNSTATGTISGCFVVNAKASTNIRYQMGYTSVGITAMIYNLHLKLESL